MMRSRHLPRKFHRQRKRMGASGKRKISGTDGKIAGKIVTYHIPIPNTI